MPNDLTYRQLEERLAERGLTLQCERRSETRPRMAALIVDQHGHGAFFYLPRCEALRHALRWFGKGQSKADC